MRAACYPPRDWTPDAGYDRGVKNNPSSSSKPATERQAKDSRQNTGPGAATDRGPTNAASASQQSTERAKQGEIQPANKKSDRSPKQENL
jgi:hypothetical protein